LEFRRYLSSFQRNKYFRFGRQYCYFRLSVVLAITFFELAMVDNSWVQLETNKFVVLLLKLVGAFLPPSATRDLLCVEWDVKLYTLTLTLSVVVLVAIGNDVLVDPVPVGSIKFVGTRTPHQWSWCWSDATALAGYAIMMMMIKSKLPRFMNHVL